MGKRLNLIGKKFSKLEVISFNSISDKGISLWDCICECGKKTIVRGNKLTFGATKSCGCLHPFPKTHGQSGTELYKNYKRILIRCNNKNNPKYPSYGGRGIKSLFRDFLHFKSEVEKLGPKPSPNHTIDRDNNDGNYEPGNIKWATKSEQCTNQRVRKDKKTSTFRGISKTKNRDWYARLYQNRKLIFAEYFLTELDAAEAYLQKYFETYKKWPPEYSDVPLCYKSPLIYKGLICV